MSRRTSPRHSVERGRDAVAAGPPSELRRDAAPPVAIQLSGIVIGVHRATDDRQQGVAGRLLDAVGEDLDLTGIVLLVLVANVSPVDATGSPSNGRPVMSGAYTVTSKDMSALPDASVAVHVTVVRPDGTFVPLAGRHRRRRWV